MSDCINERVMRPGLDRSLGLRGGDDVGSRLFDYAEPVELQLTDDRRLPCTRRAGDDEPSHVVSFRGTVPESEMSEICSESRPTNWHCSECSERVIARVARQPR